MFGATNIAKNSDKSKWVYGGYGIAFDGKVEWNFDNDSDRNALIFGVNNSYLSHNDNCRNDFSVLDEVVSVLMKVLVHQKKSLTLILVKQRVIFAWV